MNIVLDAGPFNHCQISIVVLKVLDKVFLCLLPLFNSGRIHYHFKFDATVLI